MKGDPDLEKAGPTMWSLRVRRGRSLPTGPRPVAAVTGIMLGAAALLDALGGHPALAASPGLLAWAVVLAGAFFLVEIVPVHIEWAGQAYSMSLSEAPLVVGLFFCPSLLLVAARVIGGGVALARFRKQPPHKLIFNIVLQLLEASIAVALFRYLSPSHASSTMAAAPAALAAVAVAGTASVAAVCAAVRLSVGELDHTVVTSFARMNSFGILVNSSIALVLTTALRADMTVAAPMIVMMVAVGAVYRAYVMLRQRHASLEMLYQFTNGINQTSTTDHRIRDVLDRTRSMLRAERAGLLLAGSADGEPTVLRWTDDDGALRTETYVPAGADWAFAEVLAGGEVIVLSRGTKSTEEQEFLAARGYRDAAIAPLQLDGQVRGALFVADRRGDVASFTVDDGRLFQTVAVQVSSVLDNSRLLDRLTHDSQHDALTGLANRQRYQSRLHKALAEKDGSVAVLLTDLDRFKEVNDTLGHHHGDLLIREIAGRIADTAPAIATVARLGGDEFALLVPGLDAVGALALAHRIRSAIGEPCILDGVSIDVDASIGVAVGPDHGTEESVLLKRADMAMYAAKSAHSGVEVYDHERDEYSPRRLALASTLKSAIERGELVLHYQPQMDAKTQEVVAVEALVRWQHPEYGLVYPGEFVPVAEQSGAIGELTMWVIKHAIQQLATWHSVGLRIGMSVNISMRNLLDPTVEEMLGTLLALHKLPPEALTLEITETHIMSDAGRTLPVVHRLARLGVRLSVDDFGTGYSSLSYLNALPVHEVKIDKSFVCPSGEAKRDGAIVRAIVSLSQHLGLETVAEGIEDEASLQALTSLGCTRLQGYFIARPMPGPDFVHWLATRGRAICSNESAPVAVRPI